MFFRFMELSALLEPGRPPKTDKAAILVDAVRMVTQLRGEAQKLKDSNSNLQEKIKELKVIFFLNFCDSILGRIHFLLIPQQTWSFGRSCYRCTLFIYFAVNGS